MVPRPWVVMLSLNALFLGSLVFHKRHELLVLANFFSGLGLSLTWIIVERRF